MSYILEIPRQNMEPLNFSISVGEIGFVLGANGSGKSSLMHRLYSSNSQQAIRISAHRQTWFNSNSSSLSGEARLQQVQQTRNYDAGLQARWKDDLAYIRPNIAIYDLIDSENMRSRDIAAAVDSKDVHKASRLSLNPSPIKVINDLLKSSNISILLSIGEYNSIFAVKNQSSPYSIAELSDGERNAILIATEVLVAKTGTLILIDEPERHLHRSIISPLLTQLFNQRRDCAFVISTHDVMLPIDNYDAQTLLVRRCEYKNSNILYWDVDLVSKNSDIPDDIKRDILGARSKILFVEGTEKSLDTRLYSLLFPDITLISKGSCRDIERAVASIRAAQEFHWLQVFGLVDLDSRTSDEVVNLQQNGIFTTPVYSVEAIYYHPEILKRVSERHANTTGDNPENIVDAAILAALEAVATSATRMSERIAEKRVREEYFAQLPNKSHISQNRSLDFSIDIPKIIREEKEELDEAIRQSDYPLILRRYPIRETGALDKMIGKLRFTDRKQYENAVCKLLSEDTKTLEFIRSLYGDLYRSIFPQSDDIAIPDAAE